MNIQEKYTSIKKNIAEAAIHTGRSPQDITIVAVTKYIKIESILEAINCGVSQIGENKAQELVDKYPVLSERKIWINFIGQLQTNKVKYVIDKADLIQSLDRLSLAQEIQRQAQKIGKLQDVLIQVNIGHEEQKGGITEAELPGFIKAVSGFPNIHIKGLMCVPPAGSPEEARPYFKRMSRLFQELKTNNLPGVEMQILSMGMSGDYQAAVQEGANMVRVGTALFGSRT